MKKKYYSLLVFALVYIFLCTCGQNSRNDLVTEEGQTVKGQQDDSDEEESNSEGSEQEMTYEQISLEEAKQLMADEEGYIILDARTLEEYASGHIPNAICVPNESIGEKMPDELPNKEQLILVYCRSGNRSKQASQKLAKLGYTNVKEFGGIIDWDGDIER